MTTPHGGRSRPPSDEEIHAIIERFGLRITGLHTIGQSGGFGGCYILRAETDAGFRCLRRWPARTSAAWVGFIQAALGHARSRALDLFPEPLPDRWGERLAVMGGHAWEVTTWASGAADWKSSPSPERLTASARALARMHLAFTGFAPAATMYVRDLPSESMALTRYYAEMDSRLAALRDHGDDEGAAHTLLDAARGALSVLADGLARFPTVLGDSSLVAHGDIDPEHIFFAGDAVTGIIDFDELGFRPAAGDLAMLIERFVRWEPAGMAQAIDAYRSVRPLSPEEEEALPALAAHSILSWAWEALEKRYLGDGDFSMFRASFRQRAEFYTGRLSAIPRAPGD